MNIGVKVFLGVAAFVATFHVAGRLAASAHDAPSGWSYSPSCCNTIDCRPVDGPFDKLGHHKVQVLAEANGFRITTTNEFIPFNSPMIRESKDGEFHWCSRSGADNTATICLYVPPLGY